ncbi:MAG: hypothetical protein AB8B56_22060 [Crocinitomicaceae bacterium]
MKQLSLLIVMLIVTCISFAQTLYETPHVKDGQTMQFALLPNFYLVPGTDYLGKAMFSEDKEMDPSLMDLKESDVAFIAISHESAKDNALLEFQEELIEEIDDFGPECETIDQPHVELVNDHLCLMAAVKNVNSGNERMDAFYINALEFGDKIIVFYYLSTSKETSNLAYESFKKIVASGVLIDTDKEDIFLQSDEEMLKVMEEAVKLTEEPVKEEPSKDEGSEMKWELEEEIGYKNDLFETKLNYMDILPDATEEWDEPIDENGHLLAEFTYKEDRGSIKIFSGGPTSNYPSEEEKANAIERAMDWGQPMTLTFNSQFSNEDHFFKLYSISGGATMTSVYTTIVNRELVFFVVDGGANPVDDFKPAVREFMLTMWVDYFEEEPVNEK